MNTEAVSSVGVQNYEGIEKQTAMVTRKPAAYHSKSNPGTTTDHAKSMMKNQLNVEIANKLDEIFKTGKMRLVDLDEQTFRILKESPTEVSLNVLNQFIECNLDRSSIFSALLNTTMELYTLKQALATETNMTDENVLEKADGSFNTKNTVELNPKAAEFVPRSLQKPNTDDTDHTTKYYSCKPGHRMNENFYFNRECGFGTWPQKMWHKSNGVRKTTSYNNNTQRAATPAVSCLHWSDACPFRNPAEIGVFWNRSNYMCNSVQ